MTVVYGTTDPDAFLSELAAGIEDVLTRGFGKDILSFSLLVHGPGGLALVSNAPREASQLAMQLIMTQWAMEESGAANCTETTEVIEGPFDKPS